MALQRLKEAAEKAKIELSSTTSTEINLPYIMPVNGVPKHLVKTLTRAKFEQLGRQSDPGMYRTMPSVFERCRFEQLPTSTKSSSVGGSTRIPAVQAIVEKFFGKAPSKGVNPDEVVAVGAAIQGGVLTGEVKDVSVARCYSAVTGYRNNGWCNDQADRSPIRLFLPRSLKHSRLPLTTSLL